VDVSVDAITEVWAEKPIKYTPASRDESFPIYMHYTYENVFLRHEIVLLSFRREVG
jgi:hypothetical protein